MVSIESQAGAPNAGGKGWTRREVHGGNSDSGSFITEIARGEVDVDTLSRGHLENAIHAVVRCRVAEDLDARPAVGNRVAEMMKHGVVDGFIERAMIGGEHERD